MPLTFTDLMGSISPDDSSENGKRWSVIIPDQWMQGRTSYGGLSAALCLQTALLDNPNVPPIRSAQINFIGPTGGKVQMQTKILRQGKSVCYIEVLMFGEKGMATHAVFCFGAARESKLNAVYTAKPDVPDLDDLPEFFPLGNAPIFAQHFETKLAIGDPPVSGSTKNEFYLWCRHSDRLANNMAALLAIADMPPPAVLPKFKEFAPISSMTWMLNFLIDEPKTRDGWWLLRSGAEHAVDGYSSQDMQVWNSNKELVISGLQNIAVFY
jgi:acyl-CoA thioesterase